MLIWDLLCVFIGGCHLQSLKNFESDHLPLLTAPIFPISYETSNAP